MSNQALTHGIPSAPGINFVKNNNSGRAHTPAFGLLTLQSVIIEIWLQMWMCVLVDVDL